MSWSLFRSVKPRLGSVPFRSARADVSPGIGEGVLQPQRPRALAAGLGGPASRRHGAAGRLGVPDPVLPAGTSRTRQGAVLAAGARSAGTAVVDGLATASGGPCGCMPRDFFLTRVWGGPSRSETRMLERAGQSAPGLVLGECDWAVSRGMGWVERSPRGEDGHRVSCRVARKG